MKEKLLEKVMKGLLSCGICIKEIDSENPVGIAVSGGADSVCLFVALTELFPPEFLKVITVNHGIREKNETDGDAAYVGELCNQYGVSFTEVRFENGYVEKASEERKKGIEEAARFLRYKAFDEFIEKENLSCLCLAHNQNDELETVFMRFLKGSGTEGICGIPMKRKKYIRPLLKVSRSEIEEYLTLKNISWRTDSTNLENEYTRNKIRNLIFPMLNKSFPGWDKALLNGIEKNQHDNDFIQKKINDEKLEELLILTENRVSIKKDKFYSLEKALQRRLIYRAFNKLGFGERVSFSLVKEISEWNYKTDFNVEYEGFRVSINDRELILSKNNVRVPCDEALSDSFSVMFSGENEEFKVNEYLFSFKNGTLTVTSGENSAECRCKTPFLVRSYTPGDEIETKTGEKKGLTDIFSDWKVNLEYRPLLPVVQELKTMDITAVLGSVKGYRNWITEKAKISLS